MGIAATREEDRALALIGAQDFAPIIFEHNESVLNAGVLFSLPALKAQGLDNFFKILRLDIILCKLFFSVNV